MRTNILFLFFISFFSLSFKDKDIYKIFANPLKHAFKVHEPIEFELNICSTTILKSEVACTVDIFDSQMKLVFSGFYSLDKLQNAVSVLLPDSCHEGKYLLNAYFSNQNEKENINPVIITYGSSLGKNQQNDEIGIMKVVPQANQALINFSNRYIVQIFNTDSIPIQRNFLVRNQKGELIAKGETNQLGISLIDIPHIKEDVFTVSAKDCENVILTTFSDTGFAIQVSGTDKLFISVLKGEKEIKMNPSLFIYIDTLLISETKLNFENQIGIIETVLNADKLYGNLVTFKLVDNTGSVILTYYYWINITHANASLILKELGAYAIDNKLNAINTFPLRFQTNFSPLHNLSFSIIDSLSQIIKLGQIKVDAKGAFEIPGCNFFGKSVLNLYINKSQILAGKDVVFSQYLSETYIKKIATYFPNKFDKENAPRIYQLINDTVDSKVALPTVIVKARKKSRIQEMDEQYISSGLFRSPISRDIVVEDDESAQHYNRRFNDYIMKYIPGLRTINGQLSYRMGSVEVYVDETPGKAMPDDMAEIAYIKFIKGSLRGSNTSKNMDVLKAGTAYNVGVTAYIAVYTKKNVPDKEKPISKIQLEVTGFKN